MLIRVSVVIFTTVFFFLQGCVAIQPFPTAARKGDTITLAIGSVDGANRANTTVTYYPTSPAGAPVDMTANVRSIFNLYPDPTSPAWADDSLSFLTYSAGHGPWQTVMALDLPSTLPTGTGYIKVILSPDVTSAPSAKKINDVDIAMEILPGTGVSDSFTYYTSLTGAPAPGILSNLEPNNQLLVRPTPAMNGLYYSAVEFQLNVPLRHKVTGLPPANTGSELPNFALKMDRSDDAENYQIGMNWVRNGDNITVTFTSPYDQGIALAFLRFSIVLNTGSLFDFSGTSSITSVRYYDVNGALASTSPLPELKRVYRN